ncbi:MAG: hypothetical protein JWR04_947 [Rhodoglobus sp.]|nr:hypothetical protein [Rhodoglobus sp.]
MLGYIAHGIANPMARFWLATSEQSWRHLPTPSDPPLVHAPGSDSDRVLLLGSGIAVGYGVMSHDLALGGYLARELSAITRRGASVDIVGRSDLSPASTRAILSGLDLSRFDALVLTLGGLESLTLMPQAQWRRQMRGLLEEVHSVAPASLAVFVVETGAPLLAGLPALVGRLVWRAMGRINAATAELCAEFDNTTFVAFAPVQGDVSTLTGRNTYQGWAELIAPAVARVLDEEVRTRHPDTVDEAQRQHALDALDVDSLPNDELEQIVANARDLFGAAGAAVTLIDHDLQRTKAAIGMSTSPIPRAVSICDLTIRRAGLLVVEDTMTDPRFANSPWSDGAHGRFYAGYPVESPDGQRIGALCVVDTAPRHFSDTDAALLRQLALRVQSALWGNRVSR